MLRLRVRIAAALQVVSLLLFGTSTVAPGPRSVRGDDGPKVRSAEGLYTVSFDLPTATVKVYLPDDMATGDTISGTVIAEPKARLDQNSPSGSDTLQGVVVELPDKQTVSVCDPCGALRPFVLPHIFEQRGRLMKVSLVQPGHSAITASVPVLPSTILSTTDPNLPPLAQSGRPATIIGPFDGNLTNTQCTLGSQPAAILAESPRKATFRTPANLTGLVQMSVTDKGRTSTGQIRVVSVSLSSPKTILRRNEKTGVTFTGRGLQGLTHSVPVRMECSGAVKMSGGNSQGFQITPGEVKKDGTFERKFDVTGVQTGAWSATGTIQTRPGDRPCHLAGKIVHVENNWGGKKGNWVIGIKELDGTTGYIHLAGEWPSLKFCDWIKIGGCHTDENGLVWVDDYEMTTDPTRQPTQAQTPTPTPPPTPTPTPVPPPTPVPTPPCKDGETRDATVDTKTFDVMDENSTITFQVYTDKDGAIAAAQGMSDFWKGAKKVGDILKKALPEGSTIAGWVLGYLDRGSEILDAIANSPLKDAGVSKVTLDVIVTVKRITVTCTTAEVCEKGKWVTKKTLDEKVEKTFVRPYLVINQEDENWGKIINSSRRLDRKKLGQFAQQWLHDQLEGLKASSDAYKAFKEKCK